MIVQGRLERNGMYEVMDELFWKFLTRRVLGYQPEARIITILGMEFNVSPAQVRYLIQVKINELNGKGAFS